MKKIILTNGLVALVDDDDYERVSSRKWIAVWSKSTKSYYAICPTDANKEKSTKTIIMARFVMQTPAGLVCDHINHDTLDNRKSNLRNCTTAQNNMNRSIRKDNKVGVKGIRMNKNSYRVVIRANNKRVFDKTFPNLGDAIKARHEAIRIFHGEYSKE